MNTTWDYDGKSTSFYAWLNFEKCLTVDLLIESLKWPIRIAPCGGEHQSPINIEPSKAVVTDYPRLSFVHYDKVFPETVTNNGHTGIIRILKISYPDKHK